MVHISSDPCEIKITDEERKVLHKMIDKMCDEGRVALTWEYFFPGKEPFTFEREMIYLHMGISKKTELR